MLPLMEMNDGVRLQIKDVSLLLGLPVPTIRSWERRYGWPQPDRTGGSHRRYSSLAVQQLRALRDEVARGVPVSAAVEKLKWRAGKTDGAAEQVVDALVKAGGEHDVAALRSELTAAATSFGVERAIQEVLMPTMRRIGKAWELGSCDVATEHLVTAEARRWLQRSTPVAARHGAPVVVLACGPQDQHSLALEAFGAILAGRGWEPHYLGARTPAHSVAGACTVGRASAVVITAHQSTTRRAALESITLAATTTDARVFYAGGAFVAVKARSGVPGTYLGEDLIAAAETLEGTVSIAS